jgi:hypothetical protein
MKELARDVEELTQADIYDDEIPMEANWHYLPISPPSDLDAFNIRIREVNAKYPKVVMDRDRNPTEPAPEYHFNQTETLLDFHALIDEVLENEMGSIKLTYGFVLIIENLITEDTYTYTTMTSSDNEKYSVPISSNLMEKDRETIKNLHD